MNLPLSGAPPTASACGRLDAAWEVLRQIPDPEVPVISLCELGIVRDLRLREDGIEGLEVVLTPTYSGCPATELIQDDVRAALAPFGEVRVTLQRAPAWTTDWITAEGREKLRAYGIAPPGPVATGSAQPIRLVHRAALTQLACPRCGSLQTEKLSAFGSTACKALYRCLACREPFEHFKPI
ncbi:1,2-phenylacetyl-CoA epoxidase subunit PaaD [Paucibacter sp. AS339]|uniref:1,2-phenylacetyl-CoA epoxidase subunit PaaD n=1 Tax=Paucibacter hankyongi TaxID=3133434 RepID=UPI0030B519C7